MAESKPIPKELTPHPAKWLATAIATTTALIGSALLQAWGDRVFDAVVVALGKRLLLQSGLLLLCTVGYIAYLLFARRRKSLHRPRGLYWAHGDRTPFCPYCYETKEKHFHLIGPNAPFLQRR